MQLNCTNCNHQREYKRIEKNEYGDEYEITMMVCGNIDSYDNGLEISSDKLCPEHELDSDFTDMED